MPWNNSISLTWQMFGYISWGEGIWQQLLSSETWEPETEVFFISHHHCQFPSSLNPQFLFQGWCFFVAKGPHTPQWRINTIHVFFSQSLLLHVIVFILECFRCWYESCFSLTAKGSHLSLHSKRWSHISERRIHEGVCHHCIWPLVWILVFLL